jgi:hypothetical protein
MHTRIATIVFAFGLGAAIGAGALAQTEGDASSMPGTAGVNPGSISKETTGGSPNKDTSNAGTAGTAYTGTTNRDTATNPLGTNPLSSGTPDPTGGKDQQQQGGSGSGQQQQGGNTGK